MTSTTESWSETSGSENMEYATLSTGVRISIVGYGVYQVTKDECERCVSDALLVGYRHIDTTHSN